MRRPSLLGVEYGDSLRLRLPDGEAGTAATLELMRAIVDDAVMYSPAVQRIASAIVAAAPRRNVPIAIQLLWHFLRDHVLFKRDTFGAEHLRTPDQLLAEIARSSRTAADCDDVAMLGAALLKSMGLPAFFVVASRRRDRVLEHVFFATRVRGQVVPLDPQENLPPGQWPARLTRRHVVPA